MGIEESGKGRKRNCQEREEGDDAKREVKKALRVKRETKKGDWKRGYG